MPEEIRGILGDKGSCKTLFAVFLAKKTVDAGGQVASNISSLQIPQTYTKFSDAATIIEKGLGRQVLGGKTILFDELGKGADSYEFIARTPRKLSELVFEIRKYGSIMYYTAQRLGTVTKRIREQTDYFFICEPIPSGMVISDFSADEREQLKNDEHEDYSLLLDGRIVLKGQAYISMRSAYPEFRFIRQFHFNGRSLFHLYNTKEIIGVD